MAAGADTKACELAPLLDEAEDDVLAYMTFPREHRAKIHSTNPIERLNGEIEHELEVVGIFPNEAAFTKLLSAILLEQNDVYGPPPPLQGFCGVLMMKPALAVVYPACQRGISTAGLDGIRGSAA